jgi:hypothetical protein
VSLPQIAKGPFLYHQSDTIARQAVVVIDPQYFGMFCLDDAVLAAIDKAGKHGRAAAGDDAALPAGKKPRKLRRSDDDWLKGCVLRVTRLLVLRPRRAADKNDHVFFVTEAEVLGVGPGHSPTRSSIAPSPTRHQMQQAIR